MKKMKRKSRTPPAELQNGQLWHMTDSNLQIEEVGKLLVYYRLFRGDTRRTAKSLSAKKVVEAFLNDNKAVLA